MKERFIVMRFGGGKGIAEIWLWLTFRSVSPVRPANTGNSVSWLLERFKVRRFGFGGGKGIDEI